MLKIFSCLTVPQLARVRILISRAFNFHCSSARWRYFNGENFQIYGKSINLSLKLHRMSITAGVVHNLTLLVGSLVPRPDLLTRKRVWWPLNVFLVVPSQQSLFRTSQWNRARHTCVQTSQWNTRYVIKKLHSKTTIADSAQPRKRSIVTRPFSLWEGGVWGRDYFVGDLAWQGPRFVRKMVGSDCLK